MKPIIGISGSHLIDQGGRFPGYKRAYVNDNYVQSVVKAGGIPYIIPLVYDQDVIEAQCSLVDGLILSGGHDVTPTLYGEDHLQKLEDIFPERDFFDMTLAKTMLKHNKPLLAICRGVQILNVAFGGTIYQDLSYIEDCYIKHDQYCRSDLATHKIKIENDSRLYKLFGNETMTNSFHHQAIKNVAPSFKATAFAPDKVVEAIEYIGEEFLLGVQWHPEMMAETNEGMLALFQELINQATTKKLIYFRNS